MARKCELTGKGTSIGVMVSHSNRKTKKPIRANVHKKRIWVEEEKRFVTLRLSTRALRTLRKKSLRSLQRAR